MPRVPTTVSEAGGNFVKGAIPGLSSETASLVERVRTGEWHPKREQKTAWDRVKMAIPFARETVPLKVPKKPLPFARPTRTKSPYSKPFK